MRLVYHALGRILKMNKKQERIVVLDNVRSVYNVGAIFRTADAAGVSKIILVGTTPAPVDRFDRPRKDMTKTALGAEKTVVWESSKNIYKAIDVLKTDGFFVVGVEQSKNSVDYRKVKLRNKTAFIFGNEVSGISPQVLKSCDKIIELPMKGKKESLNVSVVAGIILFNFLS